MMTDMCVLALHWLGQIQTVGMACVQTLHGKQDPEERANCLCISSQMDSN